MLFNPFRRKYPPIPTKPIPAPTQFQTFFRHKVSNQCPNQLCHLFWWNSTQKRSIVESKVDYINASEHIGKSCYSRDRSFGLGYSPVVTCLILLISDTMFLLLPSYSYKYFSLFLVSTILLFLKYQNRIQ